MFITQCNDLETLIGRFNDENDDVRRYVLAEAIKFELQRYLTTLNDTILPAYRGAAVKAISGE